MQIEKKMTRTLSTLLRVVLWLCAFASLTAEAAVSEKNRQILTDAFFLFSKGAYSQAVEKAKTVQAQDPETIAEVSFFLGTAEAKLQAFEQASNFFAKAIATGSKEPSLHYDYGQALFATQNLKEAEGEFRKSIVAKFKMGASAYYIAYIRSVLDDRPGAKDFYTRITKLQNDPDKVKQSALLEIAEMAYEDAEKLKNDPTKKSELKSLLEGDVQNLFRQARDYDSGTPIAEKATARITEIETELEGMVERMHNGNPLPVQMYTLLLSQDFTYNSNVITQADEALVQVSNKDAVEWKSGILAKYQFTGGDKFSFIPELGATSSYYSRLSTPSVYQNDNVSISPAWHTKYEHLSDGKAATLQWDLAFNLLLRDYAAAHQLPFYSRTYETSLSERVKWFATGSSTLKLDIKFVEYYDPSQNQYVPSISYIQLFSMCGTYFVNTFSFDYLHARNNFWDERNYRYRGSMTFSKAFEKVDVTPSVSMFVKDTMLQQGTRGDELNLAPSIAFNRPLSKKLESTLDFTYTKNFSKSKDEYQYTQVLAHFGLGYNF
jgi:tetratricopeptide (TPR) repeat protein